MGTEQVRRRGHVAVTYLCTSFFLRTYCYIDPENYLSGLEFGHPDLVTTSRVEGIVQPRHLEGVTRKSMQQALRLTFHCFASTVQCQKRLNYQKLYEEGLTNQSALNQEIADLKLTLQQTQQGITLLQYHSRVLLSSLV